MARPMMVRRAVQRYRVGAAVALATPATIFGSALVAWWDATTPSTLTLNGSGVASWADRVSGRTATQSTASAQLAYSSTGLNGKPAVLGSGAQNLSISSVTGFPGGTAPDTTFSCYGVSKASSNAALISWGGHPSTTNQNYDERIHGYGNSGSLPWATVLIDGDVYGNTATVGRPTFCISTDSGTSKATLSLYQDGVTTPNTKALSNPTITTLNYGNLFNVENPYCTMPSAALGCVGVVSAVATTSQRQRLEGYMAWTFGLQGNLPAGHPYASRAPTTADT